MKICELIQVTNAETDLSNIAEDLLDKEIEISTDTRTIKSGQFYLPLKGETFDGEKFINQALEKGAIGAFCTEFPSEKFALPNGENAIFLKVENTLMAYLQLANYRRNTLNPIVVAITGSSGKTTTKELVASVLESKYRTFKTPLNHNNEIGFCQTVFEMPDDTQTLVLEMGMRGLGEIELLSKYAEPDITVICNVGTAHIGRLGSKENIAKAKCEIVKYQRGKTFIAHDNELIKKTVNFDGEKIFYSIKDVKILEQNINYSKFEYQGNIYELNVGGDFNIENALAAINVGNKLGLAVNEIQKGLKKYHPIEKRWEGVNAGGYEIINDSYNANPESMRAFVDTIFGLYDSYTIILGDMGELGVNETQYHMELGEYINNHKKLDNASTVITIGKLSKSISEQIKNCKAVNFEDNAGAVNYIQKNIPKNSKLFLKASRSMKFENIIEELKK